MILFTYLRINLIKIKILKKYSTLTNTNSKTMTKVESFILENFNFRNLLRSTGAEPNQVSRTVYSHTHAHTRTNSL